MPTIELDGIVATYFFIGVAVFIVIQSLVAIVRDPISHRIALNKRMRAILVAENRSEVFVALMKARGMNEKGQLKLPFLKKINLLIIQSGLNWGLGLIPVGMVISFVVLLVALSVTLPDLAPRWFYAMLASPVPPIMFLQYVRSRRQAGFGNQLPDALQVACRSLRAGHPLIVALNLVARESPDPLGSEFGILCDEVAYGQTLEVALRNLQARVGHPDLAFLSAGIAIQSATGGNLTELLEGMSGLMRERVRMRRKVLALTAEGRFSAAALFLIPFVTFGMFNLVAPSYYGEVWTMPATQWALGIGSGWMALGGVVMYKMVNFKF